MRRAAKKCWWLWRCERTPRCGGLGERLLCGFALSLLLVLVSITIAAEATGEGEPESAGYVGDDETCAMCHDEQSEQFAKTTHGWAITKASRSPAERGCEACHGPGEAHVEEGGGKGVGNLQNFAAAQPAAGRSAACLKCHSRTEKLHSFRSSTHTLSGIACTDCHGGHVVHAKPLLRKSPPQLCYGCHLDVRAKFSLTDRHKVDEGVVTCSDCHEPHGSRSAASLRAANNQTCFRCHAEIEGPFVFEHTPVLTEGCVRCHTPHGAITRHLLKYQQVAQLCYECHTVTPVNHLQPSFRDCTRCHVSIHGSNIDPHFLQE